ncbi:hypothetical protein ACFSQ7_32050 [Paenibacillus rhizoplanae]
MYQHIAKLDAVQQSYKFYNSQVTAIIPKDKINQKYYELTKDRYVVTEGEGYRTDNNFLMSFGDNGLEAMRSKLISGTIDKEKNEPGEWRYCSTKISMITQKKARS